MTQILAKDPRLKRTLKWLFGVTCLGALLAALWPSLDEKKNLVNTTQIATARGNNATAINISKSTVNYTDNRILPPSAPPAPIQRHLLTKDAQDQIASKLKSAKPLDVMITIASSEAGSKELGLQIRDVFSAGGFTVKELSNNGGLGRYVSGIYCCYKRPA